MSVVIYDKVDLVVMTCVILLLMILSGAAALDLRLAVREDREREEFRKELENIRLKRGNNP